jgi:pyruvate dehydrogenase E2 component (dihydrolipoamide acetyltransferase)
MNAAVEGDRIRLYKSVDVGVAVGIEEGLVVPVIRGAAEKNLVQISNERRDLAERARTGKLKKEEIENCRFVISNLGMYGVTNFQAIINAPGTAILAVGAIQEEPIVDNGLLKAGKTMWVTLSLDHRVIDGAYGGKFLQRLKSVVENPGQIYL